MQQYISVVAALGESGLTSELRAAIGRQRDMLLLAEADNDMDALHAVGNFRPNVLLLDASLADGAEGSAESPLLAAIHASSPRTKTIVINDPRTESFVAEALRQGARGHLSHRASAEDCLRAARAVAQGELWIGRHELASLLDELLTQPADTAAARPNGLSQREAEIAAAVQLGLTNKEIARKLRISATTVKTYLERIFQKLNISRRAQIGTTIRESSSSAVADPAPTVQVVSDCG